MTDERTSPRRRRPEDSDWRERAAELRREQRVQERRAAGSETVETAASEMAVRRRARRMQERGAAGSETVETAALETVARRRARRARQREQRARTVRRQKTTAAVLAVFLLLVLVGGTRILRRAWAKSTLSDAVIGYTDKVKKYADQEGVSEYTDTLLAIMMVESEGTGRDVMQSSESKGLERNSLNPDESIEQACIYYAALVEIADTCGIKDEDALIQAYNFGPGYLYYLSEHGKKHSQKLATEYAKEQSGGEKVRYLHLYAIKENGGWIYKFGNMFYTTIVHQYL